MFHLMRMNKQDFIIYVAYVAVVVMVMVVVVVIVVREMATFG